MRTPRFKCFNCSVRNQTPSYDTDSNETVASEPSESNSAKPYEPPHPSARRSIGTRTACLRAHRNRRAMGAGTPTHAKGGETEVGR